MGESTPFIEFMLGIIYKSLEDYIQESQKNVPKNVPKDRLSKVLKLIKENNNITISELSAKLNVTDKTIKRDISKLKNEHKIQRVGSSKSGYWQILD